MRAEPIVVFDVRRKNALQVTFTEDDDMVLALAPDTPVQPFRIGILPRTPRSRKYLFHAHVLYSTSAVFSYPPEKRMGAQHSRAIPAVGLARSPLRQVKIHSKWVLTLASNATTMVDVRLGKLWGRFVVRI